MVMSVAKTGNERFYIDRAIDYVGFAVRTRGIPLKKGAIADVTSAAAGSPEEEVFFPYPPLLMGWTESSRLRRAEV